MIVGLKLGMVLGFSISSGELESSTISPDGFNRHKCYEQCLKNAAVYTGFGSSYAEPTENEAAPAYGSEVCGKCIAGMPCAHRMP